MENIKDTKNLKAYSEKDREYNIFYFLEKTTYPYYMLTKMEVYKDDILLLNANLSVRNYDGHTLGAEYKEMNITYQETQRIIEIDRKNTIIKDNIIGKKEEALYYEKEIFKNNIYIYLYDKNIYFKSIIKDKNKKKILRYFNKNKANNINY